MLALTTRLLHAVCILVYVCFFCSVPVRATLLEKLPGNDRKNVADIIATGTDPIDIRLIEIRDRTLVSAILKGSKRRNISILVDNYSQQLRTLIGHKNISVRKSAFHNRHKFGGDALTYSFVLEVGKGHFQEWDGPLIWTRSAFRPKTEIIAGSGDGPTNPPWHVMSQTFDHDFSMGMAIQRYSQAHDAHPQASRTPRKSLSVGDQAAIILIVFNKLPHAPAPGRLRGLDIVNEPDWDPNFSPDTESDPPSGVSRRLAKYNIVPQSASELITGKYQEMVYMQIGPESTRTKRCVVKIRQIYATVLKNITIPGGVIVICEVEKAGRDWKLRSWNKRGEFRD